MKVKDIKKLLTIGDTKISEEVKEKLKEIGFSQVPDSLKKFGILLWEVDDYEVYIEYWNEDRRYNEGVEKIGEVIGEGFYGEIFRVAPFRLYIVHLATGFDEYYSVQAIDKQDMEEVGFLRITEGYVYCGNSDDISKVLTSLVQITSVQIKIY